MCVKREREREKENCIDMRGRKREREVCETRESVRERSKGERCA